MRAVGCLFRGCSSTWFACLAPHIVPVYVVFALVAASVPGEIHTDLFNAHKIGEPYYRFNDVSLRWVAYVRGHVDHVGVVRARHLLCLGVRCCRP